MTVSADLTDTRARVQSLRERHDRYERTVVDLRLVRQALLEHVRGRLRGPESGTPDRAGVEHLDRLLRRHEDGDRPLGYLGGALEDVDLQRLARDAFDGELREALLIEGPAQPGEGPDRGRGAGSPGGDGGRGPPDEASDVLSSVSFEDLTDDPFPDALVSFLESAGEGGGGDDADELREATRVFLDGSEPSTLLRGLAAVGAVVRVAHLAVTGGDRDPIEGVRTALRAARRDHVLALSSADERLVGEGDAADPLVDLDWSDPVAMLPVRLETRFHDGDLKVRIYPEQLHVDAHEDQLTTEEREWGVRYWTRLWVAGLPEPAAVLTVEGERVSPSALRREGSELVVPDELVDRDTGAYRVLDALPNRDSKEAALELLRAFAAGEFSGKPSARYEEVRERAWARGVERFDRERAAYVLWALEPTTEDDGTGVPTLLRAGFEEDEPPLSGPVPMAFPDVDLRPAEWTRTPRAALLPDRFVVRVEYPAADSGPDTAWTDVTPGGSDRTVYERRVDDTWVRRVAGPAVREPLAVGPSPEAVAAGAGDASDEMAWMTDFREAVDAGVGIAVPLPDRADYDPATGFARVVVTGRNTSMDAAASGAALADLLAATDHTEGLALLEPGTPTNNADQPAGRSSARNPAPTLQAATGPPRAGEGTDGGRLADALGVPRSTFAHVPGAGDTRDRDAVAVNRALWPATVGYYARHLAVPGGSTGTGGTNGEGDEGEGRVATLVTNDAGLVELEQSPDGTVAGRSSLDPGSEITVRLRGTDPPWLLEATVQVADDGAFAATFDVADRPVGTTFTAEVYASPALDGQTEFDGVVVAAGASGTGQSDAVDGPLMLGTGPSEPDVEGPPMELRWLESHRDHFVDYVRGSGPFMTLRAGPQPYGVLPVSPLAVESGDRQPAGSDAERAPADAPRSASRFLRPWQPGTAGFRPEPVPRVPREAFVPALVQRVRALGEEWLDFAGDVPSVGDDPALSADDLLTLFSMEATVFTYRRQAWLLGDENPLYDAVGLEADRPSVEARVAEDLRRAGVSPYGPRVADLLFLGVSMTAGSLPLVDRAVGGFVDTVLDLFGSAFPLWGLRVLGTDPAREHFSLSPASDAAIPRELFLRLVDPSTDGGDYDPGASLLRHLLRFATLQAAVASRVRLGAHYGWFTGEYVSFPAEPTAYERGDRTVFDLFDDALPTGEQFGSSDTLADHPGLGAGDDFHDVLRASAAAAESGWPPVDPALGEFLGALEHLSTVDPERLDRLTRETMDLASHRLDAWWTSVATRRLDELRTATDGVQIGAYGFVEDLAPASGASAEYLLAPSIDQATTASVMRSASLAHAGDDDQATAADEGAPGRALSVDCSAVQVRKARRLLRGVRAGRDLSELLGASVERRLREHGEQHGLDLEAHLDDLRAVTPSVEGKAGREDTTDQARRADVVDGLGLYRRWKAGSLEPALQSRFDPDPVPASLVEALGGPSLDASRESGVLPAIHRTMEAVNDVLLVEGVHHLIHGRPDRAAAALDAHSRGAPPPELTAFDTPRSETGVTHRLLLAFGDADTPTTRSAWEPARRAVLEPADVPGTSDGPEVGDLDPGVVDGIGDRLEDPLDFDAVVDAETTTLRQVQVRGDAEPALDAWIGDLLPDPDRIGCTGEFQWEREREFGLGEFVTPAEPGTVTVDGLGFAPDVVMFTVVAADTTDSPTNADAIGWSHGVFKRAVGDGAPVEQATFAAVGAAGSVESSTTTGAGVDVAFAATDGDGNPARVSGTVTSTTEDGFEVDFTEVRPPADGPDRLVVQFRALGLADPTSVRVGTFRTPATEPADVVTRAVGGDGGLGAADFSPDHVTLLACAAERGSPSGIGVAHGEALVGPEGVGQQTTGLWFDPSAAGHRISMREDAALEAPVGDASAVRLSVESLGEDGSVDLRVAAPDGASYPGALNVAYVAVESPATETPGGESRSLPSVGTVAPPADGDEEEVHVDTGFRPGLVEVRFVPGVSGGDQLPSASAVTAAEAVLSVGAATGPVAQRSLAAGATADGGRAGRTPDAVGGVPSVEDGEPIAGPGVRIDAFDGDGFTLAFANVPEGDRPVVQYRAWPATPATLGFSAPLQWADPGRADGLSLSDLDLSPADAVALTQGVEAAGDSQLERRFGYYAFRHRPDHRPPVPDDATLDLRFTEPAPGHDVSVAEYVEVARRLGDLLGEGRAADATDLAHPHEASHEGYLPPDGGDGGTAGTLARRADRVEGELADLASMLGARDAVLSGDPRLDEVVEELEEALRRARRAIPVPQIGDVVDRLGRDHPDATHRTVDGTVLEELRQVAEHVRAGPNDDAGVDLVVPAAAGATVAGRADVGGETELRLRLRSHSDAVRFPERTAVTSTDEDGAFEVPFDFDGVPAGTAFTVVGSPRDPGDAVRDGSGGVGASFEDLAPAGRGAVLVLLAAEGSYDPPAELAAVDHFEDRVAEAEAELDAGERPLGLLRRLRDAFERAPREDVEWLVGADEDAWERRLADVDSDEGLDRLRELVAALLDGVLLDRSFERPRPDDWTIVDEPPRTTRTSEWTFDDDAGILLQSSNIYGFAGPPFEAPGTLAVVGDPGWDDYRVSVTLSSGDDDAIGVVFRYRDPDNFYRVSMDAEREYRRLVRKVDGEAELLWEESVGYEPERTYRLDVECDGDAIRATLDGEPLFDVRDGALGRGAVGLYCRANRAAAFHEVRVVELDPAAAGRSGPGPVFAADGRVVAEGEAAGWRDLSTAIAEQRYLPALLWIARVLPDVDPRRGEAAEGLAAAVDAVPWADVSAERDLMAQVLTLLGARGTGPETFDGDDLAAVDALRSLSSLDLRGLADALRAVVGPVAWTGLTELVALTGDPARPDDQRPWRAAAPETRSVVEKDPEGEVRARLERLRSLPRTDARAEYAAYSPPVRALLASGEIEEGLVETMERAVAHPAHVVESTRDVYAGADGLLAGLHDLLHHADALDGAEAVEGIRTDVAAFRRAVEAAGGEVVDRLEAVEVDVEALDEGLEDASEAIEDAVAAYLEDETADDAVEAFVVEYAEDVARTSDVVDREFGGRVVGATAHGDLATSFRSGLLEGVRHVLLRTSYFGVYGSVPASAAGGGVAEVERLAAQVAQVREDAQSRLAAARRHRPPSDGLPTVRSQVDRIHALLGEGFVVLPPFAPTNATELGRTLADDRLLDDEGYAADTWLQRVGRVRDLPRDFQRVRTYADALGLAGGGTDGLRRSLTVGQLPHVEGQAWVGRDGVRPTGGELSLGVAFANEAGSAGPIAGDPGGDGPAVAGLLVDEWVERVPAAEETLGLGLRYDDPSARAPQSLLLAVPPTWQDATGASAPTGPAGGVEHAGPTTWTDSLLWRTVEETTSLVDVRSVDLDALDRFGHLLPMLCLPTNRDTVWGSTGVLPDAPSVSLDQFDWEWWDR